MTVEPAAQTVPALEEELGFAISYGIKYRIGRDAGEREGDLECSLAFWHAGEPAAQQGANAAA